MTFLDSSTIYILIYLRNAFFFKNYVMRISKNSCLIKKSYLNIFVNTSSISSHFENMAVWSKTYEKKNTSKQVNYVWILSRKWKKWCFRWTTSTCCSRRHNLSIFWQQHEPSPWSRWIDSARELDGLDFQLFPFGNNCSGESAAHTAN